MLLLISIDGLKPSYVLEADRHGLKVPNLQKFIAEGSYAQAVTGVVPTLTYPSHATIVTGVCPAKHGVTANGPGDSKAWYWEAGTFQVPTLWDAATSAGLITSAIDWPTSVGAALTFNVPQKWEGARGSTPHLLEEMEAALGNYPVGYSYDLASDEKRARFSRYLLQTKGPDLHFAYLSSLDEEQHAFGPESPRVYATLERLDTIVGDLCEAVGGGATVAVVSDHGFSKRKKSVTLESEDLRIVSAEGSAACFLRKRDPEVFSRVRQLFQDPAYGIARVLEGEAARASGGFPGADFVLGMKPGFALDDGTNHQGDHGYLPENTEMDAAFFLKGPGVPRGKNLGRIDLRDVAPTLAHRLGLSLPAAEGKNLFP